MTCNADALHHGTITVIIARRWVHEYCRWKLLAFAARLRNSEDCARRQAGAALIALVKVIVLLLYCDRQ